MTGFSHKIKQRIYEMVTFYGSAGNHQKDHSKDKKVPGLPKEQKLKTC